MRRFSHIAPSTYEYGGSGRFVPRGSRSGPDGWSSAVQWAALKVVYLADAPYIHTRRWVQHFAALGCEAHVISFRPGEIAGATVHYIDGLEAIGKARYVVHARRVRAAVSGLAPDLVHALHLTSYGFLAGLSAHRPSIVSVWGTDVLETPLLSPLHAWITRHALTRASAITATGLRLAEATVPYNMCC
jgi:hypothetical protein